MLELGVVCGRCDTYSVLGTRMCPVCEAELSLGTRASMSSQRELHARAGITEPPSSFALSPPRRRRQTSNSTGIGGGIEKSAQDMVWSGEERGTAPAAGATERGTLP